MRRVGLLVLVGCAPGWIGAQSVNREGRALPASISAAVRDTLNRVIDSASLAGLPMEPLVSKAAEGALKGADDARILRAVRSLARELGEARAAIPAAKPSALAAAASAIHAGVPGAAIQRLAARVPVATDAQLSAALVALADLVANRVPPAAATSSIEELLRRRASETEILAFRSAVAQDIQDGRPPEGALRSRAREVKGPSGSAKPD